MTRKHLSSGSPFEAVAGYSRAVIDGEWIFVAGTTGFDYATMTISDDPVAQTRQCFKTIADVLEEAGSSLADVVRVHYYATSRDVLEVLFPVFGEYMGAARPAATALICELYDARMKIEIEVTARRRNAG
jgi:enamine deaminase RidA (YjgF/YER057c/UK114 family)